MNFSTPDLCDEYPELVKIAHPVFKNYGGTSTFGGQILTIKCQDDNSLVKEIADLDGTGKVMVVDGGGSMRRALLGDLIAENAAINCWEGFIIYGCIRDVDIISTIKIGVKALNVVPIKTERKGAGQHNIPVTFAGVTFNPGEFVYADNNGVIVSEKSLKING